MKALTIVAGAFLVGLVGNALADEPNRLSDEAMDGVVAGNLRSGVATGFGRAYSSGLVGGANGATYGGVLSNTTITNGVVSSDTQVAARSTFTAFGSGPGPTSAGGSGGIYMSVF